jgi:hypothetical protein
MATPLLTKAQLVELVRQRALQNGEGTGDDIGKLHPIRVEKEVGLMWADIIFLLLKNSPTDLDSFTKNYNDNEIEYDSTEKVYFVTLPAEVVQLPANGGIRLIKGQGTNRRFYLTDAESIDIYQDLDMPTHYDRNLFKTDGKKVIFVNWDYKSHNVRAVNMKLVVAFGEYASTDAINLPAGRSTEIVDILAKSLFSPKQIDNTNDNNPI